MCEGACEGLGTLFHPEVLRTSRDGGARCPVCGHTMTPSHPPGLPACPPSLVAPSIGPWGPTHLSASPLRAGSDLAPLPGPWSPGCHCVCGKATPHLRGRGYSSPIPPLIPPYAAGCPAESGGGLVSPAALLPPPRCEWDALSWEVAGPSLPLALTHAPTCPPFPEIGSCLSQLRAAKLAWGRGPDMQGYPEAGARPAWAPRGWHSLPPPVAPPPQRVFTGGRP